LDLQEAIDNHFAAVCVNGSRVEQAVAALAGVEDKGRPKIAAVVGFPLGAMTTSAKVNEAVEVLAKVGASRV